MTEFTPEDYLAAARIAGLYAEIRQGGVFCARFSPDMKFQYWSPFHPESTDYRALREVLDKKYGVVIYWDEEDWDWISEHPREIDVVLADSDVVSLMMRQVQELREAGVSE